VLTQLNSSKKIKLSKSDINKIDIPFNRGVDLMLSGGKVKSKKPLHIIFKKIICLFNKEIDIHFEFSLSLRNKK
jgi:hypothetical protein